MPDVGLRETGPHRRDPRWRRHVRRSNVLHCTQLPHRAESAEESRSFLAAVARQGLEQIPHFFLHVLIDISLSHACTHLSIPPRNGSFQTSSLRHLPCKPRMQVAVLISARFAPQPVYRALVSIMPYPGHLTSSSVVASMLAQARPGPIC